PLPTTPQRREHQRQGVFKPVTGAIQPLLAPDSLHGLRSVSPDVLRCPPRLIHHCNPPQALRVKRRISRLIAKPLIGQAVPARPGHGALVTRAPRQGRETTTTVVQRETALIFCFRAYGLGISCCRPLSHPSAPQCGRWHLLAR